VDPTSARLGVVRQALRARRGPHLCPTSTSRRRRGEHVSTLVGYETNIRLATDTDGPVTEPDQQMFSARLGPALSSGPPTQTPVIGVRDVIVCAAGEDIRTVEDWKANPPVGVAAWVKAFAQDNMVESVRLGREISIQYLDRDTAEMVMVACQPRGHYFFPFRQFGQVYSFVREMPASEHEAHPYRWDPDGVLTHALMFSRVIRDNGFSTQ
jgi:hypothetical protein